MIRLTRIRCGVLVSCPHNRFLQHCHEGVVRFAFAGSVYGSDAAIVVGGHRPVGLPMRNSVCFLYTINDSCFGQGFFVRDGKQMTGSRWEMVDKKQGMQKAGGEFVWGEKLREELGVVWFRRHAHGVILIVRSGFPGVLCRPCRAVCFFVFRLPRALPHMR